MKSAILWAVIFGIILVILAAGGCADVRPEKIDTRSAEGSRSSSVGPVRGDLPLTGDMTNATITVNSDKMVYGFLACGGASLVGFMFIGRRLAKHHASIHDPRKPVQ